MSHIVSGKVEVQDLESIEAACKELGLTFKRNQKTYGWWGVSAGDYPLPEGMTVKDLGKCDHAIGIPGTDWGVGLVYNPKTGGYRILYDYFDYEGSGGKGWPLLKAMCGSTEAPKEAPHNGRFLTAYNKAVTLKRARSLGCLTQIKTLPDGRQQIIVTKPGGFVKVGAGGYR